MDQDSLIEDRPENKPADRDAALSGGRVALTSYHLVIIGLILVSIMAGVVLAVVPIKLKYLLLALPPAFIVCIALLRNPFIGVLAYFFYTTLRPYDFIPALIPLRLAMVFEAGTLVSWVIAIVVLKKKVRWNAFSTCFLGFVGLIAITVPLALNNFYAYRAFEFMMVIFLMYAGFDSVIAGS